MRIGSLDLLPSNQTIRSAASLNENNEDDGASTIRPKQLASVPGSEASDKGLVNVTSLTFEQDLRQSKVYKRVQRRNSLASLSSSAAPSFGWSCLSEMSLANVSNISVISLPIAANELSNGGHYRGPSIPRKALDSNKVLPPPPRPVQIKRSPQHRMSTMGQSTHEPEKKIAILGENNFLCI